MTSDRVPRDEAVYEALLESLADGVDVDWGALDAAATTDGERRRYRNLRLVARLAELHRTLRLDDDAQDGPVGNDAPAAPKSPPRD
jgi:hypothetical protein